MRKEFTVQSGMVIAGEELRRQSPWEFPVSAPQSIPYGMTLASGK